MQKNSETAFFVDCEDNRLGLQTPKRHNRITDKQTKPQTPTKYFCNLGWLEGGNCDSLNIESYGGV